MKQRLHFLEYLYCHLLLTFFIGRVAFLLYNSHVGSCTFGQALGVFRSGLLAHDVIIAAFLLAVPWLVSLLAIRFGWALRKVLIPYYILLGFVVAAILVGDIVMYEFWQFKLGAVELAYAAYPEGATNSVSVGFIALRLLSVLALFLWVLVPCIWLTPRRIERNFASQTWFRNISIIWVFLLGSGALFTHVGDAYSSSRSLYLNHAATNPVFAFASSFFWNDDYSSRYNYLDEETRFSTFSGLYPEETEDVTDTLLNTQRPDILFVLIESFGGEFVREIGGAPGVAPNWSRLIPEGIFWENYYSNSFRTDRGTVSAYSGYVSYPEVSLMLETPMHSQLPSIARSMNQAGYQTSYLYPGAMSNMNKRQYLADMGFRTLLDDKTFTAAEMNSSWGADDSTSSMKTYHLIARKDSLHPWFFAYQTISSHEPWTVPYHRLDDKVLNAFAYTDQCLGNLIDSLKTTPQWKNLLVILIPDHGYLYHQSFQDPEFFHSPMLWLGGAIKGPRRMQVLMNQSDLAATLLSQLGLPHRDYPWSRNVLSRNYTHPFVYCNFPAGIMYKDPAGVSIFDVSADEPILEQPADGGVRIRKAQSILQTSYDELNNLKK